MSAKVRVLFLCTGNSCRSQMAEGWARHLKSDELEPYSAGIESRGVDPNAVRVMAESGVDIAWHRSKTTAELGDARFDYVITVCSQAGARCPTFPGAARVIRAEFDDPPALTSGMGDGERKLAVYRRVRDKIREFVVALPGQLEATGGAIDG